jgi:hypothetical protein
VAEYATSASPEPRWSEVVENAKVTLNLNDEYGDIKPGTR